MDEEFITKEGKSFVIRREINGLLIDYGSFSTLADAIAFKEELEEDGWPYRKDQIISGNEKKVDEYGQYITGKGNKFVVSREIAGVNVIFGVFDTLKNTKNFKYTLSENAWCVKFSDNIPKYGKFIIKQGSRYVIKREINGKTTRFGSYGNLDEALVARDKLVESNWGMVESLILSNLGVELDGKNKHIGKAGKFYTVVRWDESEYSFYGFYRTLRRANKALNKYYNSSWSDEDAEPKSSKNITKSKHTYRVSNWIDGHLEYFGHYNTFDEAIKARDLLIENDWDYNYLIENNLIEDPQIHRYIYKTAEGYKVINKVFDEFVEFGCFEELGEALDFRNKMIVNKWKEPVVDENKDNEKKYDTYIFLRNGKYYLKNDVDGVTRIFGIFNDPLDAVALRVECIKYDWAFESVPEEEYFENPSNYSYLFKSIASENGLIEEEYTNLSFPVKVGKSYKTNTLKINPEHVDEFIPYLNEDYEFYVEGTDVKGKLSVRPRLIFCENEEFSTYLKKLRRIDSKTTIRVNMPLDKGIYSLNDCSGEKIEFKVPFSEEFIQGNIKIPREISQEIISILPYEEHCAFSVGDYDLVGKLELDFKLRFKDNSVILFLESFKDYDEFLDIVLEF